MSSKKHKKLTKVESLNKRPAEDAEPIKFPPGRTAWRAFAATAVLVDGTYSIFLRDTAPNGIKAALAEWGVELTPELMKYIMYAALPLVVCNLVGDLSAVDIMRDAD